MGLQGRSQCPEGMLHLSSAWLPQEPKYAAYMELFEPLCGPAGPSRPLVVGDNGDQKVSGRWGWGSEWDARGAAAFLQPVAHAGAYTVHLLCSLACAGWAEARAGGRRHGGPGAAQAQEADTAGPARHAVDHRVQCAPAHEAAVGGGGGGDTAGALLQLTNRRPTPFPAPPRRYHYNVANNRVQQHVEKGNDDGLFISSVACCQDLWALIMDAGTGFAQQVYDLSNQVRWRGGVVGG